MNILKMAWSSFRELKPLKTGATKAKAVVKNTTSTPPEIKLHKTPEHLEARELPKYTVTPQSREWRNEFWNYLDKTARNKSTILKEFHEYSPSVYSHKEVQEAINKLSEKELKVTLKEIEELNENFPKRLLYDEHTKTKTFVPHILRDSDTSNLLILKANSPEIYEYILKQDGHTAKRILDIINNINGSGVKTLDMPKIKILTKPTNMENSSLISEYVENSDEFLKYPERVTQLNKELGANKVAEAFSAYRAERDTGLFNSIPLDKETARKTKMAILTHFNKARKVKVHTSVGQYDTHRDQKISLLKYILTKKDLTLADAMQVAKYGDEKFVNHLIKLIKNSKIKDNRFKSVSFDSDFAKSWLATQDGNTGIFQNMTIKEGNNGIFASRYVQNRQAEYIVNNDPKEITFSDVSYDKTKDLFNIDSILTKLD